MHTKNARPALARAAVLLGLCLAAPAASAPGAPGAAAPRQLRYDVSDYRDVGGKRWIRLNCDFECAYGENMEKVIATLWDFKSTPKVFSRIESVRLRSDTGTAAVTEQRLVVRVLGLAFVSDLVYGNALTRRGEKEATVGFAMIESDGSCLSTSGAWDMEDRSLPSVPSTYVRYSFETIIEPRFPGQAAIMRGFGAADVKSAMRELGLAMARS
jgi:hypothetical protein